MATFDLDFVGSCVDEIALEGLDGITLSAFWQRLNNRPNFPIHIDEASKPFLFKAVAANKNIEFYELPKSRPPLVIFNRYEHIDPELGIVVEPEILPEDIYPINVIDENGIRGSCATYNSRKNITDQIRLNGEVKVTLDDAVSIWGDKLVMVALQSIRNIALMGTQVDPQIELSPMQYCMLEKIGRTRYLGEVTQGKTGLAALNESPKTLHYYRKLLMKKRLITKQLHYQKNSNGQTASGSLLLLARFHVERQSKMQMMLQRMCETLEAKPNNMELFHRLRSELGMKETSFKKLFQNAFQKCVKTYMIPYKQMFPDAPDKAAYLQNGKERMLKICKLVHPYNSQDDEEEDDDADEDDDRIVGTHSSAFFHPSNFLQFTPLLSQAYDIVEAAGPEGITAQELGRRLGLPKLETRLLCRNLERRSSVMTIMQDVGRQRVTKYISKCHEHESEPHKKFLEERKRILEFQSLTAGESGKENTATTAGPASEEPSASSTDSSTIQKSNRSTSEGAQVIVSGTSFTDDLKRAFDHSRRDATHITYRVLKRANMIIEAVKTSKLIDEMFKLQKLIIEKETEEGYHRKVDKKSVMRLVHRLAKDGYLRSIKTILRLGDQVKKLHFVCDPSITVDDPLVKSTIEQAKFKYFGASKEQIKKPQQSSLEEEPRSIRHSVSKLRQLCSKGEGVAHMEYIPCIGRDYGLLPKFLRAKTLHTFLFYLVYDYQGREPDENAQTWPKTYTDTKDWKMYVPPLPNHPGVAKGWCLISDILLSLPLSILVKVVNITFRIEGLSEFLEDPVRCHYLIRYLPRKIRSALLFARRYIFAVYDVVVRLAFMGLASFGPQSHKEKDQVFVYVHRNASIKDTTLSRPGYFKISPDIDYPIRRYTLERLQDVEEFWLDLQTICLNTPLGSINAARGQSITVENVYTKPETSKAAQNKTEEEIEDNGDIPGDGMGAGGLDSALFAHLKRNWMISNFSLKKQALKPSDAKPATNKATMNYVKYLKDSTRASVLKDGQPEERQKRLKRLGNRSRLSVHFPSSSSGKEPAQPLAVNVTTTQEKRGKKRKSEQNSEPEPAKQHKPKRRCYSRIIKRKAPKRRRPFYDEKDKAALKRLRKQRVTWSLQEDSFLLVCKVASMVLDPKYNGMVVPCSLIRDELHKRFPQVAMDKTSRACQRRIRYMLLNPDTSSNVSVFLTEAKQDQHLMQMFPGKKPPKTKEDEWGKMFCTVLEYLLEKFAKTKEPEQYELPSDIETFKEKYHIMLPEKLTEDKHIHFEPKNIVDVHYGMVANIILSSLFAVGDKNNWSYLLYKIYSGYPESLLKSVVTHLHSSFMISKLKEVARRITGLMPVWSLPWKLSVTYNNTLLARYRQEIYEDCFRIFTAMWGDGSFPEVDVISDLEPGMLCCIVTLQAMSRLSFEIGVPEQVIVLDQSASANSLLKEQLKKLSSSETPMDVDNKDSGDDANSLVSSQSLKSASNVHFETPASKTSRIALYLLRERSSEAHLQQNPHTQDYFLIKSCTLKCRIVRADEMLGVVDGDVPFHLQDVPRPLKVPNDTMEKIINSQRSYLAYDAEPITEEALMSKFQEYSLSSSEITRMQKVLSLITDKREVGITLKELWESLDRTEMPLLNSALKFLMDSDIVVRVGFVDFRYVALWFSGPWCVHSFKIPRECKSLLNVIFGCEQQKQQERQQQISETTTTDAGPPPSLCDDSSQKTDSADATTSNQGDAEPAKDVQQAPKEPETLRPVRFRKRRNKMDPSNRFINTENWSKVHFVGRIWRKPDGTFNRSVLLKFMASVLSYIVTYPGVDKAQLCKHFNVTMPPVHLMEILEFLEELKCIRRLYVTSSHKATLFSKPVEVTISQDGTPEDIERFEPTVDGLLRLAQFNDKLSFQQIWLS